MAMVKIHGVKVTPEKTVRYVVNPEKTMDKYLIDGINCTRNEDTVIAKMKCYRKWYQSDRTHKNLSFHVIHAFSSKENISAEKAHEISMEWFRNNFPSDVLAIAATHNNTDSLHTHFVVNNISLNGKGLSFDKTWQRRAIENSNELCKRYNLIHSITDIDKPSELKMNWWEYQQANKGNSWKEALRKLIDKIIKVVKSIKELFSQLRNKGYEENETEKGVTIKPKDVERTINIKTLGRFYTVDKLEERINMANTSKEALISEYSEIEGKLKAMENWITKASKVQGMEEKIKNIEEKEKALKERQKEIRKILREERKKEDVSR
jgi:hypothetical protein